MSRREQLTEKFNALRKKLGPRWDAGICPRKVMAAKLYFDDGVPLRELGWRVPKWLDAHGKHQDAGGLSRPRAHQLVVSVLHQLERRARVEDSRGRGAWLDRYEPVRTWRLPPVVATPLSVAVEIESERTACRPQP